MKDTGHEERIRALEIGHSELRSNHNGHESLCAERYQNIHSKLEIISSTLSAQSPIKLVIIVSTCLTFVIGVAKGFGWI